MHKRKHRKSNQHETTSENPAPDPSLYIQAHEADVIRGTRAASARFLDYHSPSDNPNHGLIPWKPHQCPADHDAAYTADAEQSNRLVVWLDRYDVRLLLDHLPDFGSETTQVRPPSPSGWSDLPSDSEDIFFFSPDELEDYRRDKRRRLLERGREERLRALAITDNQGEEQDPDPWGGSDEEPDETQRELIRRTASHIISSPNPAQLEMRILANYGTDKRFAFLRGRWSRVWRTEKERARQHRADEAKKTQSQMAPSSLGGLAGYGDSDSEGEESTSKPIEEPRDAAGMLCIEDNLHSEDAIQETRRARAKQWSAQRRAGRTESDQIV